MLAKISPRDAAAQSHAALALRAGLGIVFVIGGYAKLVRLLTPSKAQGIVDEYVGPLGYINQTFFDWLFAGHLPPFVTPWSFLTTLSAFEFVSGLMLIAGLMVRPLAVLWALLLWSFVVSLPVVTTPGVNPPVGTFMSPAELVQIRDIALSGFFFVLYNLGSGAASLDARYFGLPRAHERDWAPLGLLLRLSLASVFLVGGGFAGFSGIASFGMPGWLLAALGLGLAGGVGVRYFALAAAGLLLWFMATKLGGASGIVAYLNAVKREFALLAAAGVLAALDGGRLFAVDKALGGLRHGLSRYFGAAGGGTPSGVVRPVIFQEANDRGRRIDRSLSPGPFVRPALRISPIATVSALNARRAAAKARRAATASPVSSGADRRANHRADDDQGHRERDDYRRGDG